MHSIRCYRPKHRNKYIKNRKTRKNHPHYKIRHFILFASSLGQKRPGVENAPGILAKSLDLPKPKTKIVAITKNLNTNLANLYKTNRDLGAKPRINIGGDHSMAISTISFSLNQWPNLKVLYFDAHADINTIASSNSGNVHGMPLSFLIGTESATPFSFIQNPLDPNNLMYIGIRCLDPYEVKLLADLKIQYIRVGQSDTIERIRNFIGKDPLHVSLDIDSIDPTEMPSTGTRAKHGLHMPSVLHILELVKPNIVNVDITEVNLSIGSEADQENTLENTKKIIELLISN